LLVAGGCVKEVSFSVGYRQPSAFVETFRKTFGITPKAWMLSLGNVSRRIEAEAIRTGGALCVLAATITEEIH
jgi:AraC-like DNA-binding protein